jgi:hypothetical protein
MSAAQDYVLGPRQDYEFDKGQLSELEILLLLKRNQMSILIPVIVEICLTVLWMLCSIVPGFALYNGDVNQVNAYSHFAWWLIIEFFCVCAGCVSTYYSLGFSSTERKIEKNVSATLKWMYVYCFVLAITLVSHIIHGILSTFELVHCSSSLCTGYKWVLLTALVIWYVWALVNAWTIFRAVVYANNLSLAIGKNRIDMAVSLPSSSSSSGRGGGEEVADDYKVVVESPVSQINTPLLAQLNKNGSAQRHGAVLHRMK